MMRMLSRAATWRRGATSALAIAALGVACSPADDGAAGSDSARPPARGAQLGAAAPDLASNRLDGQPASLATLRGTPVLLNVWATWCHPCRDEIPVLEALHRQYAPRGLEVVGVSIDDAGRRADIRSFADQFGVTYTIWHDPDQRVMPTFSVIGVPTTFLIDRDGKLVWRKTGEVKEGDPALLAAVEQAVGPSSP